MSMGKVYHKGDEIVFCILRVHVAQNTHAKYNIQYSHPASLFPRDALLFFSEEIDHTFDNSEEPQDGKSIFMH
jgi:hypothetical protein